MGYRGGGGHWSGRGGGGWGSQGATFSSGGANAAHNPFEVKLPKFLDWLEYNEENMAENSIVMVDLPFSGMAA